MEKTILVVNLGSASKKYALYKGAQLVDSAHYEKNGDGFLVTRTSGEEPIDSTIFSNSFLDFVKHGEATPSAVGLRLVAPGTYFAEHRLVDAEFIEKLREVSLRDMAHIQPILDEISVIQNELPNVSIVAVSDSAFHSTMPRGAREYALPASVVAQSDLYRFGYHGISVESIVSQMKFRGGWLEEKVVVCHLGSGSSVTALKSGKSVYNSMGYSPLNGIVMSTRVGDIDSGAVLRLLDSYSPDDLQNMFYKQGGLLALSELSDDMRVLLDSEASNPKAHTAIELFIQSVVNQIAIAAAILGGVDTLVFTGTIGERSEPLRSRIFEKLQWLSIGKVWVLSTDESRIIADHVLSQKP